LALSKPPVIKNPDKTKKRSTPIQPKPASFFKNTSGHAGEVMNDLVWISNTDKKATDAIERRDVLSQIPVIILGRWRRFVLVLPVPSPDLNAEFGGRSCRLWI
jgi:hypothetical protein